MPVLNVVHLGHPALRFPSSPVKTDELKTPGFQQFLDDLLDTCITRSGVGIAAPQVGINKRVIVVNVDPENPRYPGQVRFPPTIIINPVITSQSESVHRDWEGDLSVGLRGIVPRSTTCTVEGLDRNGEAVRFELQDAFHARVFQHEIDHLDGIFFTDRVLRKETLAELPEWETYWKGAQPFGITPEWERVALLLMRLTHELSAWSSVVLIPKSTGDALRCAAHYRLPQDWARLDNRFDSGSMNARAFLQQKEVISNDYPATLPPTNEEVTHYRIAASAVVLIPNVGTLEVLASSDGYRFEDTQLRVMRDAAATIAEYMFVIPQNSTPTTYGHEL